MVDFPHEKQRMEALAQRLRQSITGGEKLEKAARVIELWLNEPSKASRPKKDR